MCLTLWLQRCGSKMEEQSEGHPRNLAVELCQCILTIVMSQMMENQELESELAAERLQGVISVFFLFLSQAMLTSFFWHQLQSR